MPLLPKRPFDPHAPLTRRDEAKIRRLFEHTHKGVRGEVIEISRDQDTQAVKVLGHFRDIHGTCGTWMRSICLKEGALHVEHGGCVLSGRVRGCGIGRAWVETCLERYRALGVCTVEADVSGKIGGYVWASMGFSFRDEKAPDELRERHQAILYEILREGHITIDKHRLLCQRLEGFDFTDTQEILHLGQERVWTDDEGERQWVGKCLLIDSCWRGTLTLA
jgi:GNAT superfamily N-acetyltransferase